MPKPTTSANISAELARADVKQAEIARLLGLPESQITARMKGDVAWRVPEVQAIAGRLGVPITVLIGDAEAVASRSWNADDRTCQACARTFIDADQLTQHQSASHTETTAASA